MENEKNEKPRLRPVVFVDGKRDFFRPNLFQQNLLLKAMTITTDPKKLRQMAGLKSVADVYRTLDKLAMRKEYHEALAVNGVDFNFIVEGLKDIASNSFKDGDRLKAYKTLLQSLGMDKYEEQADSGKNWEELLIEAADEERKKQSMKQLDSGIENENENDEDYEVNKPVVPESELRKIEEEKEIGDSLYE